MFNSIPEKILDRMKYLEELDARDRHDGTERMQRLRQIPPESGQFIAFMATMVPSGDLIEIGTSAGYSTLWLTLAARKRSCRIITFESMPEKIQLARETFRVTEIEDIITLIEDDALKHLTEYKEIAFCFLDAEKEVYDQCYDLVVPNLVSGGILVADNVISHQKELQPMVDRVLSDKRVEALTVNIGKGLLLCRKK